MNKEKLSALIGRPLSSVEDANFKLYMDIAKEQLEGLICSSLCDDVETKTYLSREGYSTLFTDIFNEVESVKVDGKIVTNFEKYQWSKNHGEWFNSLVFDCAFSKPLKVEVTASWGFQSMPADLQLVLAGLFNLTATRMAFDPTIHSKRVEDFQVTYNSVNVDEALLNQYQKILSKYSLCDIPYVRHGGC